MAEKQPAKIAKNIFIGGRIFPIQCILG